MAASESDVSELCRKLFGEASTVHRLLNSRVYRSDSGPCPGVSVVGPFVGAPYAVMVLETLIAWGVREVIFWGWCGAVDEAVKIGDLIMVSEGLVDEGTSVHYGESWPGKAVAPCAVLSRRLAEACRCRRAVFHTGAVWCTDGIYRETPNKVGYFRSRGALAVEMESSALFRVGAYRQVGVAAIMVVSDSLTGSEWVPGFRMQSFHEGRRNACRVVEALCRKNSNPT